ncbi:hypothetical protein ColLi_09247 [Colletotrichum liriopes]|uniref:Uncharacterized protein n=1 Tax=Colletotrichum liriopes TaxID=708192 RepID=A0AA37LVL4_9PEZI|nr:hypothetical protein ColLi_09247 [Colletotrichum liriopes]
MSVSTFWNPDGRRRSFFEDFIRPQTVNIADRDDGARRHAAREARGTDERQRRQYTDALNRLKPTELLPKELHGGGGGGISNDDDDFEDAATMSTTLTNMELENGTGHGLSHNGFRI